MVKMLAELALMQTATDVTIAAYRWLYPRIEKGMRQQDVSALMSAATKKLGGSPEFSMCLIGESAAYPHGSKQPQTVDAGRIVLMDCGCTVHGYQSDVSRPWVTGGNDGKGSDERRGGKECVGTCWSRGSPET